MSEPEENGDQANATLIQQMGEAAWRAGEAGSDVARTVCVMETVSLAEQVGVFAPEEAFFVLRQVSLLPKLDLGARGSVLFKAQKTLGRLRHKRGTEATLSFIEEALDRLAAKHPLVPVLLSKWDGLLRATAHVYPNSPSLVVGRCERGAKSPNGAFKARASSLGSGGGLGGAPSPYPH